MMEGKGHAEGAQQIVDLKRQGHRMLGCKGHALGTRERLSFSLTSSDSTFFPDIVTFYTPGLYFPSS